MSKGDSHLFSGTSGEGRSLIQEVIRSGNKISPDKVLMIAKDPNGKIIWMEEGNSKSGLEHIIADHGHEFNGKGISNKDIPNFVLEAVYQGNIVGYQGKKDPRPIYEFVYNGKKHRIAVQVSDNGYIVGANCKSSKE